MEKREDTVLVVANTGRSVDIGHTTAEAGQPDCALSLLPEEVLLHVLDFLDAPHLVALSLVSRQWHALASDTRLWQRLCIRRGYGKIDRRRFAKEDWKQWYARMATRISVAVRNEGTLLDTPFTVLVEPEASVLALARAVGSTTMVAPHKVRLWLCNEQGAAQVPLGDHRCKLNEVGVRDGSMVVFSSSDSYSAPIVHPPPRVAEIVNPNKHRVLVVEENRTMRKGLARFIEREHCEVMVAGSMEDAIRVAELDEHHLDLMICSIRMRDGTGRELMTALKTHNPNLKGIAIIKTESDEDFKSDQIKAFDKHFAKPDLFYGLRAALRELLPGRVDQETPTTSS